MPDPEALQVYSAQHQNLTKALGRRLHGRYRDQRPGPAGPGRLDGTPDRRRGRLLTRRRVPHREQPGDDSRRAGGPAGRGRLRDPAAGPEGRGPLVQRLDLDRRPVNRARLQHARLAKADTPGVADGPAKPEWKDRWGCAAGGADFQSIVAGMLADQGEPKTADVARRTEGQREDPAEQHRHHEVGQRRRDATVA